ncbi:MAG: glycosyltransferase family 2 protein [Terracidiphilus sp.]|nr:glycosyltransferase family 2 protein [Terracidiphilus sp.]MDR3798339.1 glycosyltransferase family 2 protein [Terracidiphilus sp.]
MESDKPGLPRSGSGSGSWKPVLGLGDPAEAAPPTADWREWAAKAVPGTVFDQPEPEELIELTVIVPARNEEDCLGDCLKSLVSQSEEIFGLGEDWDLIVVDDGSTDRTAAIARGFAGVTVIAAEKLEAGQLGREWTGKNNAVWTAARRARGRWLLFTDADTIHEPGGLRHAMHEAERNKVGMLSYSPRQIVMGLAQRSLMPLVFCELALAYPPAKVSDPAQRIAAANGQFLLVEREAYRKLGGHASVAGEVLEDVALAVLAKRRRVGLRFRYADDIVAARMYRTTAAMVEGWTKNLKLLFNNALTLAIFRAVDIFLLFGLPVLAFELWNARLGAHGLEWLGAGWILALLWLRTLFRFYRRVAKSNFPFLDCAISPLGLPLFVVLLYRSWFQHRILKRVSWKGREYRP